MAAGRSRARRFKVNRKQRTRPTKRQSMDVPTRARAIARQANRLTRSADYAQALGEIEAIQAAPTPQSLREAENQAADTALPDGGTTSRLAQAIAAAPAPIMASGIQQARVDLVEFKTTSTVYVNGARQGGYDSNFDWALGSVLRAVAATGCITLVETDLSHLRE